MKYEKNKYVNDKVMDLDEIGIELPRRCFIDKVDEKEFLTIIDYDEGYIFGSSWLPYIYIDNIEKKDNYWQIPDDVIEYSKVFFENFTVFMEKAEQEIEKYYNTVIRKQFNEYEELENIYDLKEFLTVDSVSVNKKDDKNFIKIAFECDWKEGYFSVIFNENYQIVEIG